MRQPFSTLSFLTWLVVRILNGSPLELHSTTRYFRNSGLIGTAAISVTQIHCFMDCGRFSIVGGRFCWAKSTENKLFAGICRKLPKMCRNCQNCSTQNTWTKSFPLVKILLQHLNGALKTSDLSVSCFWCVLAVSAAGISAPLKQLKHTKHHATHKSLVFRAPTSFSSKVSTIGKLLVYRFWLRC